MKYVFEGNATLLVQFLTLVAVLRGVISFTPVISWWHLLSDTLANNASQLVGSQDDPLEVEFKKDPFILFF